MTDAAQLVMVYKDVVYIVIVDGAAVDVLPLTMGLLVLFEAGQPDLSQPLY